MIYAAAIISLPYGVASAILNRVTNKKQHMNWFWKKKNTGEVINHGSFNRLPDIHKSEFDSTEEEPTHEYESHDDDGFLLKTIIAAEVLSEINGNNAAYSEDQLPSNIDTGNVPSGSEPFQGFDGGDGGGGGAQGDFSSSDTSSSDSGSSDSGSSDSGGSSGSDGN